MDAFGKGGGKGQNWGKGHSWGKGHFSTQQQNKNLKFFAVKNKAMQKGAKANPNQTKVANA